MSRMQDKPKGILSNLILFAGAFLVCALLTEAGLRMFWHNPYRHERPDRILKLPIHHPNGSYIIDRKLIGGQPRYIPFRTNDRGYILPSHPFKDPEWTIVFLGGSTTECKAVQENLRFPALVSAMFSTQMAKKVNTLNMGRSGNTTHDCLNILLNHAILDKPDMAVLMEASNDYGTLGRDPDYASRMGHDVTFSDGLKWWIQDLSSISSIFGKIRALGTSAPIRAQAGGARSREPIAPEPYRARLEAFVGMCRAFGIRPVLMTQPRAEFTNALTPAWDEGTTQTRFNRVILEVGAALQTPVIDLSKIVRETEPEFQKPMKIFYDGIHVTDEGSRVYAAVLVRELAPLMVR